MKYILAHDLGTSGDKAVLFTLEGELAAEASAGYSPSYADGNIVEEEPSDWWEAFCRSTRELLESRKVQRSEISCVAFSGQMNCCLPVDSSGEPLRKAMIWADQRAVDEARRLAAAVDLRDMYAISGHRIGPSYAISKMMWFKEHESDLYKRTAKFLQAKDYLVFRLTGVMATDFSDASHVGVFDLVGKHWSKELLGAAGIDGSLLPEPLPSTTVVGTIGDAAARKCGLLVGTPVVIGGGDGCCATAGAGIWETGHAYSALGTSAWVATLSTKPIIDPEMRTYNFVHLDGELFEGCGAMQSAGLALQWAIDSFCQADKDAAEKRGISVYEELEERVRAVPSGSRGLYFLPYLLGERSPWWNPEAKACFVGLTPKHGRDEMVRAVMEGVAYNLRSIIEIFCHATPLDDFRIIGGGARNVAWLDIIADLWKRPLLVLEHLEHATSIGAALCGGIGIGAFSDFSSAARMNGVRAKIAPKLKSGTLYDRRYLTFLNIYRALESVAFVKEE
jgi:xylulokinase